jgi:hypothetical protein
MNKPIDLSRFRTKPGDKQPAEEVLPKAAQRRPRGKPFKSEFIKVPTHWREALRGAPGATHDLALAVLDEKHKRDHLGGDIVLSAEVSGLKKDARHDATRDLVGRGLIAVEVLSVKSAPRVTSISSSS